MTVPPKSAGHAGNYDAFGKPAATSAVGNARMFTGREYDTETGLYSYRARYYSADLGRFLQTDPIGMYDENTYAYCYNSPVNWADPYGLQAIGMSILLPGTSNWPIIDLGSMETTGRDKPATTTEQYFKNAEGKKGKKEKKKDKKQPDKKPDRGIREDKNHEHFDKKTQKEEPEHWHYRDYNFNPKTGK